eukprot:143983-Amorphochlora_amoeboformis.AAC.1
MHVHIEHIQYMLIHSIHSHTSEITHNPTPLSLQKRLVRSPFFLSPNSRGDPPVSATRGLVMLRDDPTRVRLRGLRDVRMVGTVSDFEWVAEDMDG